MGLRRFRGRWGVYWPYFGFAVLGIGLAAWQGAVYHHKTSGTVVRAHVADCRADPVKGVVVTCTGTWARPGGGTAHGTVDGVDMPDIGRTVAAHLHGATAYVQSHVLAPAVLFVVGLLVALGFLGAAWRSAGRAPS